MSQLSGSEREEWAALLRESLDVLDTVEPDDEDDGDVLGKQLDGLRDRIRAVLVAEDSATRAQREGDVIVTTEVATVYRSGRRRFFSKHGAYGGAAKTKIRDRCECAPYDYETGAAGSDCKHHGRPDFEELVKRLARWYAYLDRKAT